MTSPTTPSQVPGHTAGEVPEWALEKAAKLLGVNAMREVDVRAVTRLDLVDILARYIAAHEEPPVDPLVEAIQAVWFYSKDASHVPAMRAEELRKELAIRGIELSQSGEAA